MLNLISQGGHRYRNRSRITIELPREITTASPLLRTIPQGKQSSYNGVTIELQGVTVESSS